MSTEYPPRSFSDKYSKFLAPKGNLLTPAQVFKNKKLGPDGEEVMKKAFKITVKKLRKMRAHCASCGNDEGDLIFCPECKATMYCNNECRTNREELHEVVCDDLRKELLDQIVECLPSPVNMGQEMMKGKGGMVKNWDDWFGRHTDLKTRIDKATDLLDKWWKYTTLPHPGTNELREALERITTNVFSSVLTIGHSVYWFPTSSTCIEGAKEIHIHLIGADEPEVSAVESGIIQVASRCVGRPVVVTLVAPNLDMYPETGDWTPQFPAQVTPLVQAVAYTGSYADFWEQHVEAVNACDKVPRPHVAMAIHPGVHTDDMFLSLWHPILKLLAKEKIPVVMTTYNRYEFEDIIEEKLDDMFQNIVFKGKNPLGSCHSKQTPHEPDHVWAANCFLVAIDNAKELFNEEDEDECDEEDLEEEGEEDEEEEEE
ncbi:unnamed protein product, partial [Meganyctiphanes norvegica]